MGKKLSALLSLNSIKDMLSLPILFLLISSIGVSLPDIAYCDRGKLEVQVLGHYTDNKESGKEEWTFVNKARAIINGEKKNWTLQKKTTWTGDSNPNNNDYHDLDKNITIFNQLLPLQLPEKIDVWQWGWENDRGARKIYNCCSWWRNDDDDYGKGIKSIDVSGLPNNEWEIFSWRNFKGPHGLKVRAKVQRWGPPQIIRLSPNRGCRGRNDQPVKLLGNYFADGMIVNILGLGVREHDINVTSETEINFKIDITLIAPLGARDVRVSTPGHPALSATLSDGFTVLRASDPECSKIP
ncbi:MAG: hypothetical protein ACYTFW_17095 [Planctomycetota bacterium]|jgi:hypothetical protein